MYRLVIFILFIFSFSCFSANSQKITQLLNLAEFYAESGEYEEAIIRIDEALKLDPENDKAKMLKEKYELKKKHDLKKLESPELFSSKSSFRKNIIYDKKTIEQKEKLVSEFMGKQNYTMALDILNQMIKLAPTYSKSYYQMGMIYTNLNKYQLAIDNFEKCKKLNPKNAYAWFYEGIALYSLGRVDEGFKYMMKSISLAPNNQYFFQRLGEFYLKDWQLDKAQKNLEKSLKLDGNNDRVLLLLVTLERYRKNNDKALEYINRIIKRHPGSVSAQAIKVRILFEKGDYNNAMALEDKIKTEDNNLEALLTKGYLDMKNGKFEEGIKILNKVLNDDSENIESLMLLANYYNIQKDYNKMEELIRAISKSEPYNYDAKIMLGESYKLRNLTEKAMNVFLLMYKHGFRDYRLLNNLGSTLAERGYYSKAVEIYKQAIEKAPRDKKLSLEKEIVRLEELYYNQINPQDSSTTDTNSGSSDSGSSDKNTDDDFFF